MHQLDARGWGSNVALRGPPAALTNRGWGANVRLRGSRLSGVGGRLAGRFGGVGEDRMMGLGVYAARRGLGAYSGQGPDPNQFNWVTIPGGGPRGNKATSAEVAELDRCIDAAYAGRRDTKCTTKSFRATGPVASGSAWSQLEVEREHGVAWDTIAELNTGGKCVRTPGQTADYKFARCVNWWVAKEGGVQNLNVDQGSRWWVFPANWRLKVPKRGTVAENAPRLDPNPDSGGSSASTSPTTSQDPPPESRRTLPWWQVKRAGIPTWAMLVLGAAGAGAVVAVQNQKKAGGARKTA